MFEQIRLDLKNHALTTTTGIIALTLTVLLLGTFFASLSQPSFATTAMYGAYGNAASNVDKQLNVLKKAKPHPADQAKRVKVLTAQNRQLKAISLQAAGLLATPPTATVQDLGRSILALRQYELKEAEKGNGDILAPVIYPGQTTTTTLLGRKKVVLLYRALVKAHLGEIPTTDADAPAGNYLFNFFRGTMPLLLLAVLSVQFGELMTDEKRSATILLTNMVPLAKTRLWTAHLISFWLLLCGEAAAVFGAVFVIVGLKNGWGSGAYPIVYSTDGQHPQLMTLTAFLGRIAVLMLATILLLAVVSALVSLLSGELGVNLMVLGLLVLSAVPQFLTLPGVQSIARFLPATGFNFSAVTLFQTGWSSSGYAASLAVMLGWIIILYLVGLGVVSRRARL